jgi:hypothetical protein
VNILVDRVRSDDDATLSNIYIDGAWFCFGLEDEPRAHKIPAETRIPSGVYQIGVKTTGYFDLRYRGKFPDIHRGMLEVLRVLNFTDILIHIGNDDDDTAGCLLVGSNAVTTNRLYIASSTHAYKSLYNHCIKAAFAGELTIEYRDRD